jgi:hypothetical protein
MANLLDSANAIINPADYQHTPQLTTAEEE